MLNTHTRPELLALQQNIEKVIKGKTDIIHNAIICVIARGHLLLEDVPGVGKTTLAHCLARSLDLSVSRIQFTSDMLPSDIQGVTLFNQTRQEFEFKPGPLFANVVVADEINRTTPKTQSALLEAMNSAQVSVEKQIFDMPRPFMVFATQNPVEFHGTFPLPKSQMDRFMMRLHIGYPALADEIIVLREQKSTGGADALEPVVSAETVIAWQGEVEQVKVNDALLDYLARIVQSTRESPNIVLGASTRAALALRKAAQGRAWMDGRDYCVPDDIKTMVMPVLAHRIIVKESIDPAGFHHEQESRIIKQLLSGIQVPL
jgi:MoxR-like ATPase